MLRGHGAIEAVGPRGRAGIQPEGGFLLVVEGHDFFPVFQIVGDFEPVIASDLTLHREFETFLAQRAVQTQLRRIEKR